MIHIPSSFDEAKERLVALDGFATATGWERAAIVYAYTENNLLPSSGKKISFHQFAALGIVGLKSDTTVARFHAAWATAIEQHGAPEVEPGGMVELPTAPWPPAEKSFNSIRDEGKRKAVTAEAEAQGISRDMVANIAENKRAIAAAIKADPDVAQRAAEALAETSQGRMTALNAMHEVDELRLKARGGTPVPRGEKPLEWMVKLRQAVGFAEEAVALTAPYEGYTDTQREFINASAKRLVAAGEWLLDGRTEQLNDEALHQWIDGERNG